MSTTTTPTSVPRYTRSRSPPSRTRNIPSRPTTPLRPSSRSSLRTSQQAIAASYSSIPGAGAAGTASGITDEHNATLSVLEPAFAELSDGMADLEANLMHMQLMHESLSRFSESFAAFLYGMNMNAFCVDFPEAPVGESFRRADGLEERFAGLGVGAAAGAGGVTGGGIDVDNTFMTTDTSFVEHPPLSSKASSKPGTPRAGRTRGAPAPARGSTRGRGIPRASGIARGSGRGRGRGSTT